MIISWAVFSCCVIGFVCALAGISASNKQLASEGTMMEWAGFSDISGEDYEGNLINSEVLKGHRITMINCWTTTCTGCVAEMPELEELWQEYDIRDFQLIGICTDIIDDDTYEYMEDKVYEAETLMSSKGVTYLNIKPSKEFYVGMLEDIMAYPITYFVDEDGNILHSCNGSRDKEGWKEIIDEILSR